MHKYQAYPQQVSLINYGTVIQGFAPELTNVRQNPDTLKSFRKSNT